MTTPLHIREIGAYRHNLCGEEGGPATYPAAATCGMCRAVYADEVAEAEPVERDDARSGGAA